MKPLLSSAFFALSTLSAHADPLPWCPPADQWSFTSWGSNGIASEGVLVRIGSRLFRSCTRPHSPPGNRIVRLTVNPGLIAFSEYTAQLGTLSVSERVVPETWIENFTRYRVEVEPIEFEGLKYRAFQHEELINVDHEQPSNFIYSGTSSLDAPEIPLHYVYCGDLSLAAGQPWTCFVSISYQDTIASVMITAGDLSGPNSRFWYFSQLAEDMYRVLVFTDVTGLESSPKLMRLIIE